MAGELFHFLLYSCMHIGLTLSDFLKLVYITVHTLTCWKRLIHLSINLERMIVFGWIIGVIKGDNEGLNPVTIPNGSNMSYEEYGFP